MRLVLKLFVALLFLSAASALADRGYNYLAVTPPVDGVHPQNEAADLQGIVDARAQFSASLCGDAMKFQSSTQVGDLFGDLLGPDAPKLEPFLTQIRNDMYAISKSLKAGAQRPRPIQPTSEGGRCEDIFAKENPKRPVPSPCGWSNLNTPGRCSHDEKPFASFPSAHASVSALLGAILEEIYKGTAKQGKFLDRASTIARSRVVLAVHNPSDVAAGQEIARITWNSLLQQPHGGCHFDPAQKLSGAQSVGQLDTAELCSKFWTDLLVARAAIVGQ